MSYCMGMRDNRVDLSCAPGVPEDLKEVVLSSEGDDFYKKNMYLNFGGIGINIKALMDEYQSNMRSHRQTESIAGMKALIL